jgi:hypothetical protein
MSISYSCFLKDFKALKIRERRGRRAYPAAFPADNLWHFEGI